MTAHQPAFWRIHADKSAAHTNAVYAEKADEEYFDVGLHICVSIPGSGLISRLSLRVVIICTILVTDRQKLITDKIFLPSLLAGRTLECHP